MRPLQRKIQPEIMPVSIGKIPEPDSFSLSNGVPVYLIEAGSEEIMRIDFIFKAGLIHEGSVSSSFHCKYDATGRNTEL